MGQAWKNPYFTSEVNLMTTASIEQSVQTKGDLPGHPFRGNQWEGGSGEKHEEVAKSSIEVVRSFSGMKGRLPDDIPIEFRHNGPNGESGMHVRSATGNYQKELEEEASMRGREAPQPSHPGKMLIINADLPTEEGGLSLGEYKSTGESVQHSIRHELGHVFQDRGLNQEEYKEWKILTYYNKDLAEGVSGYGYESQKELFSESFAAYTHPQYKLGMLPKLIEDFLVKTVGTRGQKSPSRLGILHKAIEIATAAVRLKQMLLKDQLRNAVVKAVHVKQYEETEKELAEAVAELIKKQFAEAGRKLGRTKDEVELIEKGDLPGHPFRGNQWSGGSSEFTPGERSALEGWVAGTHIGIRIEEGDLPDPDSNPDFVSALSKLPKVETPVHRGVNLPQERVDAIQIGQEISSGMSRSWSTSGGFAVGWAEDHSKHGKRPVVFTVMDPVSARSLEQFNPLQQEAIVPKGTRYRVESKRDFGDYVSVTLEEIGNQKSPSHISVKESVPKNIFDPRDWDSDLIDTCLPILMRKAGEAAAAQMLIMGVDVAPRKRRGRTEKGDLPGHPFRGNQWEGGGWGEVDSTGPSGKQSETETIDYLGSTYTRPKLHEDQQNAVIMWSTEQSEVIRKLDARASLDGHGKEFVATCRKTNKHLEKALDALPVYEGEMYRGIRMPSDRMEELTPGSVMRFEAKSSASKDIAVAGEFAKSDHENAVATNVVFVMKSKTGADVSQNVNPKFLYQQEVVIRKGTSYKVTSVREDKIHVYSRPTISRFNPVGLVEPVKVKLVFMEEI